MDTPPPATKKNVVAIGWLSFFGGISQDIFVPILPLYLSNVLGLGKAFIGASEGLVVAGSSMFKIVSGYFVDRFGKKKPFIFLGYFLSMVARPILALTSSAGAVLGLRFVDGVGKGMKDSPKDALIADSSVQASRGRSFGIARMLDTFGSVAGPLILFALLVLLKNHQNKYHIILFLTAVPLLVTLAILRFRVVETGLQKTKSNVAGKLPKHFFFFLSIALLFSLGNSTDAFLILRAQNVGVTLLAIPLVFALFNAVYASASVPLGSLSDKIGREKVILLGWAAYAVAYLGFALAKSPVHVWLLFGFYGLYYATTEGVAKAYVADLVPPEFRGRAYGIYNTALGLAALPASYVAGLLWDQISPAAPFYFGAGMAVLAAAGLGLFVLMRPRKVQAV